MIESTQRLLASLSLLLLVSAGCDQFRSLKASNSEEKYDRNQNDDVDANEDEEPYVPPVYSSGDGDGDYTYTPPTPTWPTTECSGTQMRCGNYSYCVDVSASREHCGACNNACGTTQQCVGGKCQCYGTGQVICGGQCVPPTLGPCGMCGEQCPVDSGECQDTDSHVADWPTLGGDLLRSGYNAGEQGVPPLTDDWAISLFPAPLNPVMISGTKVFASARAAFEKSAPVFALDIATGETIWKKDFGAVTSVGQPTIAGCRLYVQHGSGASAADHVWSLNTQSGAEVWARRFSSQRNNFWSPVVTSDAVYMAAGEYGGLSGYGRSNGAALFEAPTNLLNAEDWAPVFYDGELYTFVGGKLRRHSTSTGEVNDTISVNWTMSGTTTNTTPAFSPDGKAYLVAAPSVYAFEAKTKKLLWQAGIAASGTPALAEGLLLAFDDKKLTAFNAQTGVKAWTAADTAGLIHAPVAAHGFAYVASDTQTYAVDLKTGAVVWQKAGGGWLSLGGGRLFVAGIDGLLRSYRLSESAPPAP